MTRPRAPTTSGHPAQVRRARFPSALPPQPCCRTHARAAHSQYRGWTALWLVLSGVAVVLVLLGLVLEGDLLVLALLDVDLLLVVALELGVVGLLDHLYLDPA